MAKDPICGMYVDEKTAKYKSEHMGKSYYFCCQMCKTSFDKNPTKYTGKAGGHSGHSTHPGHSCC